MVLRSVNGPLRVWREVPHRDLLRSIRPERGLTEQAVQVKRRTVCLATITEVAHPVVIEEEVHRPVKVCRAEPLDVDGERRIAAAAGLALH